MKPIKVWCIFNSKGKPISIHHKKTDAFKAGLNANDSLQRVYLVDEDWMRGD